mgnify:CR=1 FL=1
MIDASQADILVTSCPICYKTFKEDYLLNIKIMHHTEYIDMLIREGKLKVNALDLKTVFHNPCELGRGCGGCPRKCTETSKPKNSDSL